MLWINFSHTDKKKKSRPSSLNNWQQWCPLGCNEHVKYRFYLIEFWSIWISIEFKLIPSQSFSTIGSIFIKFIFTGISYFFCFMYNIQISLTQMVKNIYIYKVMLYENSFWDSEFIFTYRYIVTWLTARDVTKADFFKNIRYRNLNVTRKTFEDSKWWPKQPKFILEFDQACTYSFCNSGCKR